MLSAQHKTNKVTRKTPSDVGTFDVFSVEGSAPPAATISLEGADASGSDAFVFPLKRVFKDVIFLASGSLLLSAMLMLLVEKFNRKFTLSNAKIHVARESAFQRWQKNAEHY